MVQHMGVVCRKPLHSITNRGPFISESHFISGHSQIKFKRGKSSASGLVVTWSWHMMVREWSYPFVVMVRCQMFCWHYLLTECPYYEKQHILGAILTPPRSIYIAAYTVKKFGQMISLSGWHFWELLKFLLTRVYRFISLFLIKNEITKNSKINIE